MNTGKYMVLKTIKEEINKLKGVKSIILFGSRSRNDECYLSDYDIFVVLPFVLVPFYYQKLKNIEDNIVKRLGIDISITPLPIFRIKRSKGNLLFFKMKNEGVTLSGNDYLKIMRVGNIRNIDTDEFFSYYFSSVRSLIKNFRYYESLPNDNILIAYDIAKSILYCSEIRQYLNGIYIQNRKEILWTMLGPNYLIEDEEKFRPLINFALNIYQDNEYNKNIDKMTNLWLLARDYSISTFKLLSERFNLGNDLTGALKLYQKKRFSIIKAFQYIILFFLKKRKIPFVILYRNVSVERCLYVCSFYLMISIRNDLSIDNFLIYKASKSLSLSGLKENKNPVQNYEIWNGFKSCILDHWELACRKSII